MIGQIWSGIDAQVLRNGFRKSGIYPVNRDEVNKDKFDMLKLIQWDEIFLQQRNKEHVLTEEQQGTGRNPKSLVSILLDFFNIKLKDSADEFNSRNTPPEISVQNHI
ncbi:unnamed protein product [Danaus chrysippus]|uniref:(African queen) hypothetical protein n=1 Tax=Danaus chrysippus TaxID=151541 RepID=A0A8J2MW11_9NEOP|nr:unnamed protein product [Danaus chrysippus]